MSYIKPVMCGRGDKRSRSPSTILEATVYILDPDETKRRLFIAPIDPAACCKEHVAVNSDIDARLLK
jgi:hypothetical protein